MVKLGQPVLDCWHGYQQTTQPWKTGQDKEGGSDLSNDELESVFLKVRRME